MISLTSHILLRQFLKKLKHPLHVILLRLLPRAEHDSFPWDTPVSSRDLLFLSKRLVSNREKSDILMEGFSARGILVGRLGGSLRDFGENSRALVLYQTIDSSHYSLYEHR